MSNVKRGKKRPYADRVHTFLGEFPDLFYDGALIKCRVCQIDLMCWDKRDCTKHVNSASHRNNKNGVPLRIQFMFDLIITLIRCNISPNILNKVEFKEFWNKYCTVELPSYTTFRSYVPRVRTNIIESITSELRNKKLWLCVDETTDCKKHSILNVIVRVLDPSKPTYPLLLASTRLTECTGNVITRVILETLQTFQLSPSQVLMFVTDSAATMLSVGHSLITNGCQFLHITCKLHALHLVAEAVRKCFPEVDTLIATTKKVFLKSPKRLRAFHAQCPGIPEPPQPVLTRWGTWLAAAFYYAQHFTQIKSVILQFNPDEAAAIKESQTTFQNRSLETDLKTICDNYTGLHVAIQKLEQTALPLVESLQILDEVTALLQTISDAKNDSVRKKFETVVEKNKDFTTLREICDGVSASALSQFKDYFTNACITSVDVERSFSQYKNIFAPKRTLLAEKTIETYLMVQFYYRHSPQCNKNIV